MLSTYLVRAETLEGGRSTPHVVVLSRGAGFNFPLLERVTVGRARCHGTGGTSVLQSRLAAHLEVKKRVKKRVNSSTS